METVVKVKIRKMPRVAYFFLVIAHLAVVGSELNSCQPVSKHFYKKYSTKTPYQYIVDELGEIFY